MQKERTGKRHIDDHEDDEKENSFQKNLFNFAFCRIAMRIPYEKQDCNNNNTMR